MSFNQDQVPKRVRFVDDPEVHSYTPDTSPSSASSELRTPSDNGTLPLPSMASYIAQCTTWAPGFVPSTVLVPPGYMLVAPPAPPAAPAYALGPTGPPAVPVPAIHHTLARPPFQWDVRTALPPTDLPYRSEPAFSTHASSVTLRFADFAYPVVSAAGGGAALRVVDVLRAVHEALYTRVPPPRDATVRRAAEVAQGYRALKRDGHGGGLLRVDTYPVSPNRVGGARLFFVGLEWGEGRGEVWVLLGPGA